MTRRASLRNICRLPTPFHSMAFVKKILEMDCTVWYRKFTGAQKVFLMYNKVIEVVSVTDGAKGCR